MFIRLDSDKLVSLRAASFRDTLFHAIAKVQIKVSEWRDANLIIAWNLMG